MIRPASRCYVPRPLGESGTTAGSRRLRGSTVATGVALVALALGLAACGGGQRQDATEPSGNFATQVTKATFPRHQLLVHSANLQLGIKNVGNQTIPDLAVTIYTGKIKAGVTATGSGQGSFNVRLDNPNLSNPNRPVWVLEKDYPRLLAPGDSINDIHSAPSAGAVAAQTDTFQFGPVSPGGTKSIVWRVTPVHAGTFPVHYRVAAGLQGKARAVTRAGGPVEGDFMVTISSKPPRTCVNGAGQLVTKCGP
jgi:hypothetical protein